MSNTPVIETHGLTRRFRDTGTQGRGPNHGNGNGASGAKPRLRIGLTHRQGQEKARGGAAGSEATIVAVDNLDITVNAGEVFGFLGHNGAGKTTTIRMLNGVLGATSGSIRVLGLDPLTEGPALRRQTGVLTETPSLDDRLTARETLGIYGQLYYVEPEVLTHRIPELLDAFGLEERADEYVGGFSKGMRQRLALARTLIHQPEILFLDEPTGSLDPVGQRSVHELITRLSRGGGRTIFLCTHDLIEAQKLCDRVAVMEHGRLVALGTPEGLAHQLQKGVAVEITLTAPAPQAAVAAVAQVANTEVTWSDDGQIASVKLPVREGVPDVVGALVSGGARIYSILPQEPTLEDVYFALHGLDTAGSEAIHTDGGVL